MTYENVNISAIDKFKALWRRYRAKKTIHETRREFENLFYEIQKEREYEIQWRYEGLCAPVIVDKSGSQRTDLAERPLSPNCRTGHARKCLVSQSETNKEPNNLNDREIKDASCQTSFLNLKGSHDFEVKNQVDVSHTNTNNIDSISIASIGSRSNKQLTIHNAGSVSEAKDRENICSDLVDQCDNNTRTRNNDKNRKNILTESWLSDKSFGSCSEHEPELNGKTSEELTLLKEDLMLELLWINQAIGSRKTYLHLKCKSLT